MNNRDTQATISRRPHLNLLNEAGSELVHLNRDSRARAFLAILLALGGAHAHGLPDVDRVESFPHVQLPKRHSQRNLPRVRGEAFSGGEKMGEVVVSDTGVGCIRRGDKVGGEAILSGERGVCGEGGRLEGGKC